MLRFAAPVGMSAVLAGLCIHLVANAPTPKRGAPITHRDYAVDVGRLRDSRERWPDSAAAVHDAADALATRFVQSSKDVALERFLEESERATKSRWGKVVAHATMLAFKALHYYLGWSRPDASGFLRKATLYVASEDQLRALWRGKAASPAPTGPPALLDVGSGRGTETAKLAAALEVEPAHVTCVETSGSMRRTLRALGFQTCVSSCYQR